MNRLLLTMLPWSVVAACSGPGPAGDVDARPTDAGTDPDAAPPQPYLCSPLFDADVVPEYHVTVSATEWARLEDEFLHVVERTALGLDPEPLHPIELRYGAETAAPVPGVMMHLNGGSSWLQTIELDANPKMQFVISFNEVDRDARFLGIRKVQLDMPRDDQTFLRQRVALAYMREAGVPAPCANNARLYINGAYYGLYTNLERQNKDYLQRIFPEQPNGDLWKHGYIIKTNESTFTWDRIDALWAVTDMTEFGELVDVDASMHEWASEVMIGDQDGYANGRANFYLYDHPTRGFIWLPNDLDTALDGDYLAADASPVVPPETGRQESDWRHYLIAMRDPVALEAFVAAVADQRARYDVPAIQARVTGWADQIATAAADDPLKPFTMAAHDLAVANMRDYVAARAAYLDAWLACWQDGGADGDLDGVDMCHDCDDGDDSVRPGAAEVCNLRDDDCDGHVDNIDGVSVCP